MTNIHPQLVILIVPLEHRFPYPFSQANILLFCRVLYDTIVALQCELEKQFIEQQKKKI